MYSAEQFLTSPFLPVSDLALALGSSQKDRWPPIFLSIETTGLVKEQSMIFLIGAVRPYEDSYLLSQWFAETPQEEKDILQAFLNWLPKEQAALVHFNGEAFALSFLRECCTRYALEHSFDALPSLDLYRKAKSLKSLLSLPRLRQVELEAFFDCHPRNGIKARTCPALYQQYVGSHSEEIRSRLLYHNLENLIGITDLTCILTYDQFTDGGYDLVSCQADPGSSEILFHLSLHAPLPKALSVAGKDCRLEASGRKVTAACILSPGRQLRLYHQDYRSYDYLPLEDKAVPRSLSGYLDRSLKKPAVPETCYTWFTCTDAFLQNPGGQKRFLSALLPILTGLSERS